MYPLWYRVTVATAPSLMNMFLPFPSLELLCLMLNIFGFYAGCFSVKCTKINNNSWNPAICFLHFSIFFLFHIFFFLLNACFFINLSLNYFLPSIGHRLCLFQTKLCPILSRLGSSFNLAHKTAGNSSFSFSSASLTFITSLTNIFLYFPTNPCIMSRNQSMLNSLSL